MPRYTANLTVTIYADDEHEFYAALAQHDYDDTEVIAVTTTDH